MFHPCYAWVLSFVKFVVQKSELEECFFFCKKKPQSQPRYAIEGADFQKLLNIFSLGLVILKVF